MRAVRPAKLTAILLLTAVLTGCTVSAGGLGVQVARAASPPETPSLAAAQRAAKAPYRSGGLYVFSLYYPGLASASLAGTFNDWSEDAQPMSHDGADDLWTAAILLEPGRYEYKFVLNGGVEWIEDVVNPEFVADPYGGKNSVVVVEEVVEPVSPTSAGTPKRHPGDLHALIQTSRNQNERCGPERVARLLAEGADPNYVDESGNTTLRLALAHGLGSEVIRILIESGADPGSAEYLVLASRNLETMRILVDAGTPLDASLGVHEPDGWTALMSMAYNANTEFELEALRFMIAEGSDAAHNAPDGKTAYSLAAERLTKHEDHLVDRYPDGNVPDFATKSLATHREIVEFLKEASEGQSSSSLAASPALRPPIPFIDRDVCPGEGCHFGRWIADEPITVYSVEGEPDRIAFVIEQDESYVAETGNMWIQRPGLVRITKAVELGSPVDDGTAPALTLSPGDTLAVLTRLGEGWYHVWREDAVYLVKVCWTRNVDPTSAQSQACGILIDECDCQWWIRVRNNAGDVGWIRG